MPVPSGRVPLPTARNPSAKRRALVRNARNAPAFHLRDVAVTTGESMETARDQLTALPLRGRCAEIAASLSSGDEYIRASARAHQAYPPQRERAATGGALSWAATGTASWASRGLDGDRTPRSAVTAIAEAAARGASSDLAFAAETGACPPLMLEHLSAEPGARVAANPSAPAGLLNRLARVGNPRTKTTVAANPAAPEHALAHMAKHDPQIAGLGGQVAEHPGCPPKILALLAGSENRATIEAVVRNPATPPDALRLLAPRPNLAVAVVEHPNCPLDLLVASTRPEAETDGRPKPPNQQIREAVMATAVARHPSASAALLHRLASCGSPTARWNVAANPNTEHRTFQTLSTDNHQNVRQRVAGNPNCGQALLERLARDPSPYVRQSAAANPGCGEALLAVLTADPAHHVRHSAAGNPNCPPEKVAEMGRSDQSDDRRTAAQHTNDPALVTQMSSDQHYWTVFAAVSNPACPADTLRDLAVSGPYLAAIAANPASPADLLERLAMEPDEPVRRWVAGNPSTPTATLIRLAGDRSAAVRERVADNGACPAAARRLVSSRTPDPRFSSILRR